jgi:ATP-dependent Clp protease adaptor protein ClpS|tara:strand:+ start:177 stop:557 length:381 start_codon:yes stop_codon:yes gene_type:complete
MRQCIILTRRNSTLKIKDVSNPETPGGTAPGDAVLERRQHKTKTPKMYRVVLLNDDYTTMEFVVSVLEGVFQQSPAEAFRLMMQVHTQGQATCGTYTYEVAETKVDTVRDMAQREGFPLQAVLQEG